MMLERISDSMTGRERPLSGEGTFELAHLVEVNEMEAHPLGLREVFGDGVLLNRIRPLAAMRRSVFDLGYHFAAIDKLSPVYDALPLLQLAEILDRQVIPYRRNAVAMQQIIEASKTMHFDELTFRDLAPQCLTSHESAHAVFFEVARRNDGELLDPSHRRPGSVAARRFVEVLVASEGFALGFDVFIVLVALADPRPSTMHFLSVNSAADQYGFATYDRENPGVLARLSRLALAYPAELLRLLCASCLISNLRPRASSFAKPELVTWLSKYARFPRGYEIEANCIASIGLKIDYAFRMRTAPTLFRFLGLENEFRAVSGEPLEAAFEESAPFSSCFDGVLDMVGSARRPS